MNNEIYSLINSKTNEKIIGEAIKIFLNSTNVNINKQITTKFLSGKYLM